MKKRVLSIFLVLCMAFTTMPTTVLAGEYAIADEFYPEIVENSNGIWNSAEQGEWIPNDDGTGDYIEPNTEPRAQSDSVMYPVTGGNLYFDPTSGVITDCDTSVTSAMIPDIIGGVAVTSIGVKAFEDCRELAGVTIPNGIIRIDASAFSGCWSLTTLIIPNSVTYIAPYAFHFCKNLINVTIPNSVTTILGNAFDGCSNLTAIHVEIGNSYYNSDGISLLSADMTRLIRCPEGLMGAYTIPNTVTTIESEAFEDCSKITSVTIPNRVIEIRGDVFFGCSQMKAILVEAGNPEYSSDGTALLNAVKTRLVYCPKGLTGTYVIPNSVTTIGVNAFYWCDGLTSITIPNSVTTFESFAFANCSGLTSVTIPNSVTTIGESAFDGCSGLTSVTIPNSVTTIGGSAFASCSGLTSVTIPYAVSTIENYAFYRCNGLTDVYYGGTETQWSAVSIGSNNDPLTSATIHYNGGTGGDTPSPAKIAKLYPENGSIYYFKGAEGDNRMRIFFDHEVSCTGTGGRPELDFSVGTLQIHKASDDSVVYQMQYGTEVSSWDLDGRRTGMILTNASANLDYGTEYYVTMPAGFAILADGSVSPAIAKGEWSFRTVANGESHSVTYQLNGGTWDGMIGESWEAGQTVDIPRTLPTKDGYTFGGWSGGTTMYQPGDTFTMPDHDVTLTAVWRAEFDYSVTYLVNGGTGDVPAAGYLAGQTVTITNTIPTKEGYVFDGWSDGSTIYQPGNTFEMPTHDVTLTAIWKEAPVLSDHSVTYRLNGGTGSVPAKGYLSGQTVTVIANIPTKEGYTFGGWSDGTTTYQPGDTFTMPDHDVTLTAVWEEIFGPPVPTFTVTYSLDGGVGNLLAEQHKLNEAVVIPALIPKKEGCVFIGWSDGSIIYQVSETFKMPNHDVALVAVWTEDAELAYVQYLTQCSLKNIDEMSKELIQNAICNLLFKAQFRPTTGPKIDEIPVAFTGTLEENMKWPVQNKDSYAYSVSDKVLGRIPIEGSAGCQAYASFAVSYTYGTSGVGTPCQNRSATGIKEFVHKWVDPGEHIRYTHSTNLHSIVFLGEDEGGKGFYFISYEGGVGRNTTCHDLAVKYQTYEELAKKVTTNLNVRDANGGSYFEGTAKSVASIREKRREITRLVVRLACPVEATLTRNGETLDSRNPEVPTSFGSASRIDDEIIFTLDFYEDYEMVIFGTGKGAMTFTAEYYTDESLVDKRTFVQVPITSSTTIGASLFDPMASLVLHSTTNDEEGEITWGAGINEIVYGPNEDYSSLNNGSDTIINPPYISNYPSSPGGNSSSSGGSGGGVPSVYSISVGKTANGSVTVSPKPAATHSTVTITVKPDSGYVLDTLTVTDKNGKDVKLTSKGTSKYTFIMPDSKVTVSAFFRLDGRTVSSVFSDVPAGYWAKGAIDWASANGYMKGLTGSVFNPEGVATRQQVWMILARLSGQSPSSMAEARIWAMNSGLTDGTKPGAPVTRQQMVTFLHRYCGMRGYPVSGSGDLTAFRDYSSVSDYAKSALAWAVGSSIITGTKAGTLNPGGFATRAQFAVVLKRFYEDDFSD